MTVRSFRRRGLVAVERDIEGMCFVRMMIPELGGGVGVDDFPLRVVVEGSEVEEAVVAGIFFLSFSHAAGCRR